MRLGARLCGICFIGRIAERPERLAPRRILNIYLYLFFSTYFAERYCWSLTCSIQSTTFPSFFS
jgi:hypothetical protein